MYGCLPSCSSATGGYLGVVLMHCKQLLNRVCWQYAYIGCCALCATFAVCSCTPDPVWLHMLRKMHACDRAPEWT
jgi:hypothetical protein